MKVYLKWMTSQYLIHAAFWSVLFFAAAFPVTHKWLMTEVSDKLIAFNGLVGSVGIIVVNSCFNKYGDRMFKLFRLSVALEIVVYATILPLVGFGKITPTFYYLTTTFVDIVLLRNIVCCNNRLRKLLYDKEVREKYDNSCPIANAAGSIIGSCIGMLSLPLWLAWCFVAAGVVIGDIFLFAAHHSAVRK